MHHMAQQYVVAETCHTNRHGDNKRARLQDAPKREEKNRGLPVAVNSSTDKTDSSTATVLSIVKRGDGGADSGHGWLLGPVHVVRNTDGRCSLLGSTIPRTIMSALTEQIRASGYRYGCTDPLA